MAMSGVWGKLWGSDPLLAANVADREKQETAGKDNTSGAEEEPEAEEAFGGLEEAPITDIGAGGGSQAAGSDKPDVGGGVQEGTAGVDEGEGSTGIDGTETAVTTDEIEATKQGMSEEDKAVLFEMLMTKLPQESWQQISAYMEEGLTEQELTSVQQIMAQHLDTSEYEKMMGILKKY